MAVKSNSPVVQLMDEATATKLFKRRTLKGKMLAALQAARAERDEDAIREQVMDATDLRAAFEEMGDAVPSKDLFPLVQAADPDGDGVVTLKSFLAVVELRRSQIENERSQKMLVDCYVAMGGDGDRDVSVKSDVLKAVALDFVGSGASERAMNGVVAHKMKAVQEVLDMGGALDDEEMDELKDTSKLSFEELQAFAAALQAGGADPLSGDTDDVDDGTAAAQQASSAGVLG